MVATARQLYEGRWLHSGEPFEAASEADADDLVAIRFAARVNRPAIPPVDPSAAKQEASAASGGTDAGNGTQTSDKPVEQSNKEKLDEYRNSQKNTYGRRDMRNRR